MKHWMNELCREPAPGGDARPRPDGGSVSSQQQALDCTTRYLEQAQQKGPRRDPGGEQGGAPTPSLGNDSHPRPGRRSGSPTRVRQRARTPPASHTDPRVPGPSPGHLSPETAAATWPSLPLLPTAGRGGRRPTSGSLLASHVGVPARGGRWGASRRTVPRKPARLHFIQAQKQHCSSCRPLFSTWGRC